LQAVFSGPGQQAFIDLSWAPNMEADLAGYNVYRQEDGGAVTKINAQLVTAPAFRDEHVSAGTKYVYAVTAVDARGNESPRSSEASENVP
jgi:fibronectin type 3 domain-containing protein